MISSNLNLGEIQWQDTLAISACFVIVLIVGFLASTMNRGSVDGYFLANRSLHWIPVGFSMFSSNIGTEHFIGLTGRAAKHGISVALYEIQAGFVLLILGWLFMPVYIASGVSTMPEYLRLRFGGSRIRLSVALLSLLIYIFTKISANLYTSAMLAQQIMKLDLAASLFMVLGVAAVFTITGGMSAVIWSDLIQTLLMTIGSLIITIKGFQAVGGYEGLKANILEAYDPGPENATNWTVSVCDTNLPSEKLFELLNPADSDVMPWPGYFGILVSAVWYWCTDQVIVQRALASKNFTHAKAASVLAGFMKITTLFTLVFPGLIARTLRPDIAVCGTPERCTEICGNPRGCASHAFSILVFQLVGDQPGLIGFIFGATMAALASSMTSVFNSSSTIVTRDIYIKLRKGKVSNKHQMIVGRLSVLIMVFISVGWVFIIGSLKDDGLYFNIRKAAGFLSAPLTAVFVAGLFWKRATEPAVFYGLSIGMLVGLVRMAIEYSHSAPLCGEIDTRPAFLKDFHYLYFSLALFAFTGLVIIVMSLLTEAPPEGSLRRLTFWTRHDKDQRSAMPRTPGFLDDFMGDEGLEDNLLDNAVIMGVDETGFNNRAECSGQKPSTSSGVFSVNINADADCSQWSSNTPNSSASASTYNITNNLNVSGERNESSPGSRAQHCTNCRCDVESAAAGYGERARGVGSSVTTDALQGQQRAGGDSDDGSNLSLDIYSLTEHEEFRGPDQTQISVKDAEYDKKVKSRKPHIRIALWILGIETSVRSAETHAEEYNRLRDHRSLNENELEAWMCSIFAAILAGLTLFVHIYWSSAW